MTDGNGWERRMQDFEDGLLEGSERSAFLDELRNSSELRGRYLDHMGLSSALRTEARAAGELRDRDNKRWRLRASVMAPALAACLVAMLVGILSVMDVESAPPVILKSGLGTQWAFEEGGLDERGSMLEGTRIRVEHGVVGLDFPGGTRVAFEGPGELEYVSEGRLAMTEGSIWCEVADGDEGFSVRTGRIRVVDLGTRFGVRAGEDGDEVHVAAGRVLVRPLAEGLPEETVNGGEAVRANVIGRLSAISCDSSGFLHGPDGRRPEWRWSFEDDDPSVATDGTGTLALYGTADGKAASIPRIEGAVGKAVDLRGTGLGMEGDFVPVLGDSPRTVAVWICGSTGEIPAGGDPPGKKPSLVSWGDRRESGGWWNLYLSGSGRTFGTSWSGSSMNSLVPDGASVLDGDWHHLATVFTGKYDLAGRPEVRHFLDGEEVPLAMVSVTSGVRTVEVESGAGFVVTRPMTEGSADRRHRVLIDELVVAPRALGAGGVRALYNERPAGAD